MQNPRDILTPEALAMLQTIGSSGSFAAAARVLGVVPSALTYRVRQIEDALDVLLFDRSAKQASFAVKQERYRQRLKSYSERMSKRKPGSKPPQRPEPPKPPSA